MKELSFAEAILEAMRQILKQDDSVYLMGLGVADPGGIFGTTAGLRDIFGPDRVMDMPCAENGMTGIAIGSALAGMRPILCHQRVDFALLSMEQIVNQAAKWHYLFHGQLRVPLVIRLIIGRGWGQGPQHSQSLTSWFSHIPGLKVAMPFTPADAKGLLTTAVEDDNPVIFLEHRCLHKLRGPVQDGRYCVPFGKARIAKDGTDITLVGASHTVYECLRAAQLLQHSDISAEIVDLRTIRPLDIGTVLNSVRRTGHLIVVDDDWSFCGLAGEILALVAERAFAALKAAPLRLTWPDHPLPASPALSQNFYTQPSDIARAAWIMLDRPGDFFCPESTTDSPPHDVPNVSFTGPF